MKYLQSVYPFKALVKRTEPKKISIEIGSLTQEEIKVDFSRISVD